jgi:MSHA biogenesis protein MshQ
MPRYSAGVFNLAAENNNDGVNLAARVSLNQLPAPGWSNGSYAINAPAATFSRPAAPDGPFDALDIGVSMTDVTDSVTLGNARNMLPTNNTLCTTATCTHQKLTGSPMKMRFGRLTTQNAYGSERLALPVPWQVQYWNGTAGFIRNTVDSCTALVAGNVSLQNPIAPVTGANVTLTSITNPTAGVGSIVLSAPNGGAGAWANIGSVDLILNLGAATTTICPPNTTVTPGGTAASLAFLATNSCGAAPYASNPTARAFFGVYKSPLIYRRENY